MSSSLVPRRTESVNAQRTLESRHADWTQLDHVIDAVVTRLPQLAGIKEAAPDASFRIRGQKLARSPNRNSGRTASGEEPRATAHR